MQEQGLWEPGTAHAPFFKIAKKSRLTVAFLKKQEQAHTSAARVAIDLVAELFRLMASMSFCFQPSDHGTLVFLLAIRPWPEKFASRD